MTLQPDAEGTLRVDPDTSLSNLKTTLSRVEALLALEDDAEAGVVRPTETACRQTLGILTHACSLIRGDFPLASPSPDGEGGIHVYWRKPGRNVQLNVPADGKEAPSIFHRDGFQYRMERDSGPAELARWLSWFNE